MTRWAPQKADTLAALATEILHNYGRGRVVVGIDGVDGAGKTHFADALAMALAETGHEVHRASIDGFHQSRAVRHARGKDSPEGFSLDSYNDASFRSALVEPFRAGAPFRTAVFDHRADAPVHPEPLTAGEDAVLLVDGIFLHRPELRGLFVYTIWLDVPRAVAEQRLRDRDGESGVGERSSAGQDRYIADVTPSARATAIIDNTDFDAPRRVFADSC